MGTLPVKGPSLSLEQEVLCVIEPLHFTYAVLQFVSSETLLASLGACPTYTGPDFEMQHADDPNRRTWTC